MVVDVVEFEVVLVVVLLVTASARVLVALEVLSVDRLVVGVSMVVVLVFGVLVELPVVIKEEKAVEVESEL